MSDRLGVRIYHLGGKEWGGFFTYRSGVNGMNGRCGSGRHGATPAEGGDARHGPIETLEEGFLAVFIASVGEVRNRSVRRRAAWRGRASAALPPTAPRPGPATRGRNSRPRSGTSRART